MNVQVLKFLEFIVDCDHTKETEKINLASHWFIWLVALSVDGVVVATTTLNCQLSREDIVAVLHASSQPVLIHLL